MSSDVISILDLEKQSGSNLIVVEEINGCDSSFIISCVLGHCIKNKIAVLVLTLQNSQLHYQNVGLRLNYNLQKYVESGLVNFYDLGNDCINNLLANNGISLEEIFLRLKVIILSLGDERGPVNVILDGVSHLFDLQFSLRDINIFCKNLNSLCTQYDKSFMLCHCNVANEEDDTHVLTRLLCHMAQTVVVLESLSSGRSADISGHLSVTYPGKKFETQDMFSLEPKQNKYLFKLFDRGVKLFAPGTI